MSQNYPPPPPPPIGLYELHLFRVLAEAGSFTRAAQRANLTQSAMTRQIQSLESRLGVRLLERTTRRMALTAAGEFLLRESGGILGAAEASLRRLREEFQLAPKVVNVGVARSVGVSYLPGFFHAFRRARPEVQVRVQNAEAQAIMEALAERRLDVGFLCEPNRIPPGLAVTHRFEDAFTLIAPAATALPRSREESVAADHEAAIMLVKNQPVLALDRQSQTGRMLAEWLRERGVGTEPAMELDSFDTIIALVALGMGCALVPQRSLAAFRNQRAIRRLAIAPKPVRTLAAITRSDAAPPEHLAEFVRHVLF